MELVFAYLAGLLTLINPCVLPILPIVLGSALQQGRQGPLFLAAGMGLSFVSLGMLIATTGRSLGLTEELLSQVGAGFMLLFGAVLLLPRLSLGFERATAGFASTADRQLDRLPLTGARGQFLGGILLGAVWSPCIGPTLGGAVALASQGESLLWAGLIMSFFAFGVGTIIIGLGYGTGEVLQRRKFQLRHIASIAKPLMGAAFLLVGLMILFRVNHLIETWLLDILPYWLQDLSVAF